jgi:hypothetical protein
MGAEITKLEKQGQKIVEGGKEVVHSEQPNGNLINLRYLLEGLGLEDRSPGRLNVFIGATAIELFTKNLNGGVEVFDMESNGETTHYTRYDLDRRTGLCLNVIQTEIWKDNNGIRIRHVN